MLNRLQDSTFARLWRLFFAQFFASESVTSDHQMRQAMIGALAFLITPGFLLPLQMTGPFEFAAIRFPALLDPLIRLMATLFITYAVVAIGLIAVFEWDALGFDRRDAMVLGPLPLRGTTIVAAKLGALAVLLLATAAAINVMTAVPFSMVAASHEPAGRFLRYLLAHLTATMSAATFAFGVLVSVRSIVGIAGGGRVIASLLQFAMVGALLCLVLTAPTTLHVTAGRRAMARVYLAPIPGWSPTNWFLGLYEVIRGTGDATFARSAWIAVEATFGAAACAVLTTIAGYRRQLQRALTPVARERITGAARLQRGLAAMLLARDRTGRAVSDFILTTIARNRAQQAPIAICAAIGLAFTVAALSRGAGDLASLMRARTATLWIPLVLAYWVAVGLRAAFFVPSELPAAWCFRMNAPACTPSYWSAVRASTISFLCVPVMVVNLLLVPVLGWRISVWHVLITTALVVLLGEVVSLTIAFVPFTRAYQPGHARLKTRWPLYLIGMWLFAYWPARLELSFAGLASPSLQMLAVIAALIIVCEASGRRRAKRWSVNPEEEIGDGLSSTTVLDLGVAVQGASHI